ncbi:MAG: hypothetical protein WA642_06185 [Steroidobacteraceae bacterium]
MISKRGIGILSAALLTALSAAPGHAAYVTYAASGTITEADGMTYPGALAAAATGEKLTVDFTVDTSTPGSAYAPGANLFPSAVVAADASIGLGTVGLGVDTNEIVVAHNSDSSGVYTTAWLLDSSGNTAGLTGTTSEFLLLTSADSSTPLNLYKNASLSNAPLQPGKANSADELVLQFTTYSDGVYQSQSELVVGDDVSISRVRAPEIDPASATSALTLLLGSLAVLCGRRGVKVGARPAASTEC